MDHFQISMLGGQWGDDQIAGPLITEREAPPSREATPPPLARGGWNVMPGGAVAAPRYPYPPKDGTGVMDGWPTPAQWAYGDAGTPLPSSIVAGDGGYIYQVYSNGDLWINKTPTGGTDIHVAKGTATYNAIAAEIGLKSVNGKVVATKSGSSKKPPNPAVVAASISGIAQVTSAFMTAFGPASKQAAEPVYSPVIQQYAPAPSGGIGAGVWVAVAGVVVLVVGGIALFAGRKT